MEQSQSTQDHSGQISTESKIESDQDNDKDNVGSDIEDEEEDFVPEAEDDEVEVDSHSDSESDEPTPRKRQKTQLQASKSNTVIRNRAASGTITSEVLADIQEGLGYDPRRKSDRKRAAPQRLETKPLPFDASIKTEKKRKIQHADSDDSNDNSSDFEEEYAERVEIEDEPEDFEVPYDETSSSEQESDGNSDFGGSSRKSNAGTKLGSKSRNLRKRNSTKSYCEDSDDDDSDDNDEALESDDSQNNQLEGVVDVETSTEPTIEKILDHRLRAVGTNEEVKEMEYLVNWKGKAHIHNTWMIPDELMKFKGNKKLTNYIKNYQADLQWRQGASDDQQESADIAMENFRETYSQWHQVDRVIAVRDVDNEEQHVSVNNENNNGTAESATTRTQQYLVKWTGLPYSEATWEFHKDIAQYQHLIDAFLARNETTYIPCGIVPPHKRPPFQKLESQPSSRWFTGELRDYQLEGLNWLIFNWTRDINGILADEMGLGKTVQTITLLGYLQFELNVCGPFLVVVPLSTISNWENEFKKWCPDMNVVVYTGNSKARNTLVQYEFYFPQPGKTGQKRIKFNVLLTTYELILKDKNILGEIKWTYLAVDEGHRLKNNESMLHEVLMEFNTGNRLLLTGTPLQNSIKELWSLLFFLNSEKFNNLAEFQSKYSDLKEQETILKLHDELKPYLLRRVKKDVEKSLPAKIERILRVEMTPLQKKYYKWILTRNYASLNKGLKGNQASLLNIVMELKKASNHPYLFDNAEDLNSSSPLEALIKNSGKLILLDKLLVRLKETGHRVLIFSQMVRMLDILSDYMAGRGFQFQRLDGSMSSDQRQKAMQHFNAPDSTDFCFILSTRAGGLGINLTTADTVIIFDSDWNPQNDLQAEARAHRIGQKKVVSIYRLVTKRTVEEDILQRAKNKMVLDHLVIQTMGDSSIKPVTGNNVFNKQELAAILQFGAKDLFQEDENTNTTQKIEELDIDDILARAETSSDVQGTTAGEELLNAFKVADFNVNNEEPTYDPQLWSKIVPKSAIEETQNENKAPLYLPPRQRKRVHESEPFVPKQFANAKKQKTQKTQKPDVKKKASKVETKQPKQDGLLSAKEIKNFIQSFNRFGQLKRLGEVIQEAKLDHPLKEIEKIATEIVSTCTEAIKNAGHKKVYVEYGGVKINASELIQRMEDMSHLEKKISGSNPDNFRPSLSVKSVKDWACKWSSRDDAMLLYGIHRHGFGNWEAIQQDKSLGLSKKISTNLNDMLPKPAELKKRVDVLLASLASDQKEGKHKSRSDRKESNRSHSRHSKEDSQSKLPHKHRHKSNSEHTKSESKTSDSKVSSSKSLATKSKEYLDPVKDKLHKFRDMQHDTHMSKEERLQKTKSYLLSIGDQIASVIEKHSTSAKQMQESLWHQVSSYASSQMTGEKLQKLYEAIKKKS